MRCTRLKTRLVTAFSLRIEPTICGARHTPSAAIDSHPRPTPRPGEEVAPRVSRLSDLGALAQADGTELGVSTWHEITEQHVAIFAEATGEGVDPSRY